MLHQRQKNTTVREWRELSDLPVSADLGSTLSDQGSDTSGSSCTQEVVGAIRRSQPSKLLNLERRVLLPSLELGKGSFLWVMGVGNRASHRILSRGLWAVTTWGQAYFAVCRLGVTLTSVSLQTQCGLSANKRRSLGRSGQWWPLLLLQTGNCNSLHLFYSLSDTVQYTCQLWAMSDIKSRIDVWSTVT